MILITFNVCWVGSYDRSNFSHTKSAASANFVIIIINSIVICFPLTCIFFLSLPLLFSFSGLCHISNGICLDRPPSHSKCLQGPSLHLHLNQENQRQVSFQGFSVLSRSSFYLLFLFFTFQSLPLGHFLSQVHTFPSVFVSLVPTQRHSHLQHIISCDLI